VTSRLATRSPYLFPEVASYFPGKAEVTGYPVRHEFWVADCKKRRGSLGWPARLPALLVFGGSGFAQHHRALSQSCRPLLPAANRAHHRRARLGGGVRRPRKATWTMT